MSKFLKAKYFFVFYIITMILVAIMKITKRYTIDFIKSIGEMDYRHYNLTFNTHRSIFTYLEPKIFLFNIIFFIPLGFFILYFLNQKINKNNIAKSILICLLIIVIKELLQFVLMTGFFDVRDILLNFIGAIIGLLIYVVIHKFNTTQKKLV